MKIYTDGSCLVNPGGPGGWAWVATEDNILSERTIIRAGGCYYASSLQMELMAILEALRWWDEQKMMDRNELIFYVDSHQVIGIIANMWGWGKRNWHGQDNLPCLNLLKQIFGFSMQYKPKFQYIEGHANNPFNILADNSARKMAIQFRDGQLVSYSQVEVGDSVAARASGSIYTKVYKVYAKLDGSGNILLKRAYQGAPGDLIAIDEDTFNKTLFIRIIW